MNNKRALTWANKVIREHHKFLLTLKQNTIESLIARDIYNKEKRKMR